MSARHEVVLDVEGMTCASCVDRIERVLKRNPQVLDARVSLTARRATITTASPDPAPLIGAIEKAGYRAEPHREAQDPSREASEEARAYLRRFAVSAFLSFYVVLISLLFGHTRGLLFVSWALATPVQFYCGWPFLRAAARAARHGVQTMDTLVAVGSLAAYGYSAVAVVSGRHMVFFDTAAMIVTLILLGRWLEARARGRAGDATRLLLERAANAATVVRDSVERRIPAAELVVGDRVIVLPGEKVPADCRVVEGASGIDLSLITGESVPTDVVAGDEVPEAALNGQGRLVLEVLRVGPEATLARIVALLERAQSSKAPIQRLADRIAAIFVPVILWLALGTFAVRLILGSDGVAGAVMGAAAVLLVACPCSLGLATPAAIMAGSGRAAELGIFFRDSEVFETVRRVGTVLLDKTGTVTRGEMRLGEIVPADGRDGLEVLALAAGCELGSEHPIARAVVEGAAARGVSLPKATGHVATPGAGVRAVVGGAEVWVGRPDGLPAELARPAGLLEESGASVFGVWRAGEAVGLVSVVDEVKDEAPEVVRSLRGLGLDVGLVSGDRAGTVRAVAERIGVARWVGEVRPEEKVEEVRRSQATGRPVAFVGDGVNDGPALAQADAGIALGTGADVAIEAAAVTVLAGDLGLVTDAVLLARRTYRVIAQNLAWAFGYNLLMVPLAVIGRVSPLVAAGAMAGSSLTVVMNALRLRRFGAPRAGTPQEPLEAPTPVAVTAGPTATTEADPATDLTGGDVAEPLHRVVARDAVRVLRKLDELSARSWDSWDS